jgi:hypothetical protein
MSAKSNYLESAIIEAALRSVAFDGPSTVYMSLHTGSPGETGASNEVTGNAYARTAITFGANSGGACSNDAATTFPTPTPSDWGTVSHFALWDASSAGNCLYYGALTSSVVTSAGVALSFPIGSVVVTET